MWTFGIGLTVLDRESMQVLGRRISRGVSVSRLQCMHASSAAAEAPLLMETRAGGLLAVATINRPKVS
jgi:hypothetical protein